MNSETKGIGSYDLLRELARGSFGRVYLARHSVLTNRIVAIEPLLTWLQSNFAARSVRRVINTH
jgi:serine/threonine protein kinase